METKQSISEIQHNFNANQQRQNFLDQTPTQPETSTPKWRKTLKTGAIVITTLAALQGCTGAIKFFSSEWSETNCKVETTMGQTEDGKFKGVTGATSRCDHEYYNIGKGNEFDKKPSGSIYITPKEFEDSLRRQGLIPNNGDPANNPNTSTPINGKYIMPQPQY
jgi:hypothetical protein